MTTLRLSERRDWIDLRNRYEPEVRRVWRSVAFECRADGSFWTNGVPGSHSSTELDCSTDDLDPRACKRSVLFWLRLLCGAEEGLYEIALTKLLDVSGEVTYRSWELRERVMSWEDVARMLNLLDDERTYHKGEPA